MLCVASRPALTPASNAPAKEGWGTERVHDRNFGDNAGYSSSKSVAQDTTLLRNAISPVL